MPNTAVSDATTRSHDNTISNPPASAGPLTAAMIGLGKSRVHQPREAAFAACDVVRLARRDDLEIGAGREHLAAPGHDDRSQRGVGSISSRIVAIVWLTSGLIALRASGRFSVTSAM